LILDNLHDDTIVINCVQFIKSMLHNLLDRMSNDELTTLRQYLQNTLNKDATFTNDVYGDIYMLLYTLSYTHNRTLEVELLDALTHI
jgi:hypothetical protein